MNCKIKDAPAWARALMKSMNCIFLAWPPDVIYCMPGCTPNERQIKHEQCHMEQYKRDGLVKYFFRYWRQFYKVGYSAIDYEQEARAAENE